MSTDGGYFRHPQRFQRRPASGEFLADDPGKGHQRGTPAGRGVVKQLLAKHGFVKRKARTGLKVTADMIDMRFRGTLDAQISFEAR